MSAMIDKVGRDEIFDKKLRKHRKFMYRDVHFDPDGWVDASRYLPAEFDLVYLKISDVKKTITGWIVGNSWDGLRIKPGEKVLYWKRQE
jgi:hypothetical protein